jgi:diguanylate cyclase (GGDEF)-like protein
MQSGDNEVLEPLSLTASLGVGCLEGECKDLPTLLAQADVAAYRAKQRGRNRVEVQ